MRRLIQTLSLALASLLLAVSPAAAADETPAPPAEGFGSGMWDGLVLAAVFGVIMGLVLFIDAYSGTQDEATAHADDEHGHR